MLSASAFALVLGTVAPASAVTGEAPAPEAPPAAAPAASELTVTTGADSGAGSFREAVAQANATEGPQTIRFAPDVSEVTVDSPLGSTDALVISGAGVTLRPSEDWAVWSAEPGGRPTPDALLFAERSALTVSGLLLDAAQTAGAALHIALPSERDAVVVEDAVLRDPVVAALEVENSNGPVTVTGTTLEQRVPENQATGINTSSSAAGAFTFTDVTVTGFGNAGALFTEWEPAAGGEAQIRFDRATFTGNGDPDDPQAPAGAIALQQSNDVPTHTRLVVTDSLLSENSGYFAGGIAVSAPSWDTPAETTMVAVSGSTFENNVGRFSSDLQEMPMPSRSMPSTGAREGEDEAPSDKAVAFDVANSTFVSTDAEFTTAVTHLENPSTRTVFSHVTVLNGFISFGYMVDTPVFEVRDSVLEARDRFPFDQPQPARSAAGSAVATSLRSAYIDAGEVGNPSLVSGTDDVIVPTAADLGLGALADNGGHTPTVLPAAGSPLIDAGESGTNLAPDQRGVARPQGPRADIGAVEVEVKSPPTTTPPTTTPPTTTPPTTTPPTTTPPTTQPPTTTDPGTDGEGDSNGPLAQTGSDASLLTWGLAAGAVALLGGGLLALRRWRTAGQE